MIQAILLDIEGTTCPVDFVSKTLFPFAQKHLRTTLATRKDKPEIASLVDDAIHEWSHDSDPTSQTLWKQLKQNSTLSKISTPNCSIDLSTSL